MTNFLHTIGEICGDAIFIDDTKIEACANKYTFVRKKSVTKNLEKLLIKLADLVANFIVLQVCLKEKDQSYWCNMKIRT